MTGLTVKSQLHTQCVPLLPTERFFSAMSARGFGSPSYSQHPTRSLALGLQATALPQPPSKPQRLLSHAGRHPGSGLKTAVCNHGKSLGQTKCLRPSMVTCKVSCIEYKPWAVGSSIHAPTASAVSQGVFLPIAIYRFWGHTGTAS